MAAAVPVTRTPITAGVVSSRDTERLAAMQAANAARQAEEAAIVAMSDADLVARLAECNRAHWTAVQNGVTPVPSCGSFLEMQYATRSRVRQMPSIPMPTNIPSYQRYAAYESSKDWMDDNLPRGPLGAPIKLYVSAAATLKTGVIRGDPATSSEKLAAVGILALPFVAGYIAHKKSQGDLRWTIGAGIGVVPVLTLVGAVLVLGGLAGSYMVPGFASALQPMSPVLGPIFQPLMRIANY